MFVGMWMAKEIVTIEPTTTLDAAARLMADNRIRRLPVLENANRDSKLVGILSSTDLLRSLPLDINPFGLAPARNKSVSPTSIGAKILTQDVMTRDPLTIAPDAPIEAAAALLRDHKIGALPVVRGARLLGLLTESDVFRAFTQLLDLSAVGARISFDISQQEDVLPFIATTAKKHDLRVTSFVTLRTLERPMCVVHVVGRAIDAMLDDVWKSHHRVASILRGGK